jgi:hypothetical protein
MRFDFSSQFLRVQPPDKTFGDAWESLCYTLLIAEYRTSVTRLKPPDMGLDILHRSTSSAYQCKAHEQGAFGAMSPTSSIDSLRSAHNHQGKFDWKQYCLATNADYSGEGLSKIINEAHSLGIADDQLRFLGSQHWDELCTKHENLIAERFDYRVSVSEKRVIEALHSLSYYDRFVAEYGNRVTNRMAIGDFRVVIANNRTQIRLEIPFSPDLTVTNLVDVAIDMLGVPLELTNFDDANLIVWANVSLTVDSVEQRLSQRVDDVQIASGQELELSIKIAYSDPTEDKPPVLSRILGSLPRRRIPAACADLKRAEAIIQ